MAQDSGQLAFDFTELEREEAHERLDEWTGAPLRFTTGYYSPDQLDEAYEHWCFVNGRHGAFARSHMWARLFSSGAGIELNGHRIDVFQADLSPSQDGSLEGPGGPISMAVCEHCQWQVIAGIDNEVVEAWHDHALPGWRDLPVVPEVIRVRNEKGFTKQGQAWIEAHYPAHMQIDGAPIITQRSAFATRHAPRCSPWDGYDLSATALHRNEEPGSEEAPTVIMERNAGRSITS